MKGTFLFLTMFVVVAEIAAWLIISPDTPISRAASLIVGVVLAVVIFIILVISAQMDDGGMRIRFGG